MLAEHDAGATFFVSGMRVAEQPGLAARTVASGHGIGSHAWDHRRLTGLSADEILRCLECDVAAWQRIRPAGGRLATVSPRPYLRPPYGAYDDRVLAAAARAGFGQVILWDVDPADWTEPGSDAITERVLTQLRAGSIVELHVIEQTAEALPDILAGLAARNLRPVTLRRLLANGVAT